MELNYSNHTIRAYQSDLLQFFHYMGIKDTVESKDTAESSSFYHEIQQVDLSRVREYLSYLFNRNLARSSIVRKISAIKSFYKYLKREGIPAEEKVALLSSPKVGVKVPSFLTIDEIFRLLDSLGDSLGDSHAFRFWELRDKAIFEVFYACGCTSFRTGLFKRRAR